MTTSKEFLGEHTIEISELRESDIPQLQPILETHVRDRFTGEIITKEVEEIKSHMRGGVDEYRRKRKYLVARDETGKVWGCMAYATPDPDMVKHFGIENPDNEAELLNAFVSAEVFRGGGVGKKIFEAICKDAKENGRKNLFIHSGPRYKKSWGFYDKMCGENHGLIIAKYGYAPDGTPNDAMTWKKEF